MRIVMLTARSQPEDRETAHEMGADDYITKPFSPIQLLEKVRDVLGPEALL
jgi:DNA-binding response OmpR family regulator